MTIEELIKELNSYDDDMDVGWYDEEKSTDIFTPSFCQEEFTF